MATVVYSVDMENFHYNRMFFRTVLLEKCNFYLIRLTLACSKIAHLPSQEKRSFIGCVCVLTYVFCYLNMSEASFAC